MTTEPDPGTHDKRRLVNRTSVAILVALLAGILYQAHPWWKPPPHFDAYGYIAMAKDPFHAKGVVLRMQQRLTSALLVHVVSRCGALEIPQAFRVTTNVGFLVFAALLFRLLFVRTGRDGPVSAAFCLLLLLSSWVITYNLIMVYQVCDMLTYVWTMLIILTLLRDDSRLFWLVSLPALFTRQNLAVLVLVGAVFHAFRWIRKRPMRHSLVVEIGAVAVVMLGAAVLAWAHRGTLVWLLQSDGPSLKAMVVDAGKLSLPFTGVLILRWRAVLAFFARYWPLAIFCAISIYQPHSGFYGTRPDNALRLSMQGVWVLNLAACLVVVDELRIQPVVWKRWLIIGMPVLWVGIRGAGYFGWLADSWLVAVGLFGAVVLAAVCFREAKRTPAAPDTFSCT